jgi:hypothetical protein
MWLREALAVCAWAGLLKQPPLSKEEFMATLIPEYNLSDFKKLKAGQIRRLKSCELVADGEYVCTVIIPQSDYIRMQAEYKSQLSNSVGGEDLADILNKEPVTV